MKDGGPAFPFGNSMQWKSGMSLRDYFAAAAMNAIIIAGDSSIDIKQKTVSKAAYFIADEMVSEREKQ